MLDGEPDLAEDDFDWGEVPEDRFELIQRPAVIEARRRREVMSSLAAVSSR